MRCLLCANVGNMYKLYLFTLSFIIDASIPLKTDCSLKICLHSQNHAYKHSLCSDVVYFSFSFSVLLSCIVLISFLSPSSPTIGLTSSFSVSCLCLFWSVGCFLPEGICPSWSFLLDLSQACSFQLLQSPPLVMNQTHLVSAHLLFSPLFHPLFVHLSWLFFCLLLTSVS